jgi:hypothetical protein
MKLVQRNLLVVSILWLAPRCEANLIRGKKLESFLKKERRHLLEDDALAIPPKVPPSRECGQVINLTTVAQIKVMVSMLLSAALPEASAALSISVVESIIKYDVQAQVVCASCNKMRSLYDRADFMNEEGRHAFMSYCGDDRFATDVTHSSLLLIPHDLETGKPVQGILKSHLYMKGYNGAEQLKAPSEFWLDDFRVFELATICHSPNDEVIPIGHAPDVSINPLLSTLTLLGQGPSGGHAANAIFCRLAFILQFSASGSALVPLSGIEPLTDASTCTGTVAPTTAAPVITVAPATLAPLTLAPVKSTSPESDKKGKGKNNRKGKKDKK